MVAPPRSSEQSSLTPALDRLARARTRQRSVRIAIWGWCALMLAWLLPVPPWTVADLPPPIAAAGSFALALVGVLLVVVYRHVSRTTPIRAALAGAASPSAAGRTDTPPAGAHPLARWAALAALTALTVIALLAAPVLHFTHLPGMTGDAAWLLQPLAGLVLATRWRMRGAACSLALSLGLFGTVEWLAAGRAHLAAPATGSFLVAAELVNAVVTLSIGWLAPRLSRGDHIHRSEDHLCTAVRARDTGRADGRFRSLVQNVSDVMMVLRADGTRRYVSPSVTRVLGYQPEELAGASFFALVHPEDMARMVDFHLDCLNNPGISPRIEFRCRDRDGSWRYLEAIATNLLADASVGGLVVTARDITERKLFEDQLAQQAFHDALTGLPNRPHFMDRLARALDGADHHRPSVAVMFLDLDRFKIVNDSLGHGAGDELLVEVAQRLRTCMRRGDTAARFGGDEFTALLEGLTHPNDAIRVAERIIEELRQPFTVGGQEIFTGASIGIAFHAPTHTAPDDLLRDADIALYQAKTAGKGRFVVFSASMNQAVERIEMETDLRRAVERGELRVHYQPEVDLDTSRIVGMEALVRWQRPGHGLVAPTEFIPLAEETGLIIPIGRWVLEEACRQAKAWADAQAAGEPPLVISVNLSVRQFSQPDLAEQVAGILQDSGLDPTCLRLEITESTVMHDTEATVATLHALKTLGVRLAIDDFGTGYSSLSYLRRFPFDTVKIDRSFVNRLHDDKGTAAIVQAVTTLAYALGMEVTVEGIETQEQLAGAWALRCLRGQGFLFSQPLPGDALGDMLRAGVTPSRGGTAVLSPHVAAPARSSAGACRRPTTRPLRRAAGSHRQPGRRWHVA